MTELPPIYSRMTLENLIISGNVVISGVVHRVSDKYVVCDSALNNRAWNTTEPTDVCRKCFNLLVQLSLFE